MNKEKELRLIKIDSKYVDFLRKFDNKVQINSEEYEKETKPFFGILFNINELEYFVPLSSGRKFKYEKMYEKFISTGNKPIDMVFVTGENKDKTLRLLSVINLNNMIPVPNNAKIEFDIDLDVNANLLRTEYAFCKKNANDIISIAKRIYNAVVNNTWESLAKRSCNFTLLEEKCREYSKK
jgi:protein AbiQ